MLAAIVLSERGALPRLRRSVLPDAADAVRRVKPVGIRIALGTEEGKHLATVFVRDFVAEEDRRLALLEAGLLGAALGAATLVCVTTTKVGVRRPGEGARPGAVRGDSVAGLVSVQMSDRLPGAQAVCWLYRRLDHRQVLFETDPAGPGEPLFDVPGGISRALSAAFLPGLPGSLAALSTAQYMSLLVTKRHTVLLDASMDLRHLSRPMGRRRSRAWPDPGSIFSKPKTAVVREDRASEVVGPG